MPHDRDWIGEARRVRVEVVAQALKMDVRDGQAGPCPACGATKRDTKWKSKRLPIELRGDGLGWNCYRCDAKGDGVALVALVLGCGPGEWASVARWYRDQGWISDRDRPGLELRPGPVRNSPVPEPEPAEPPAHLDPGEVRALWGACASVGAVETASWLDYRASLWGLDPDQVRRIVEGLALVRCCRRVGVTLPAWAAIGRAGWPDHWPLVFPCFDADGALVALRARRSSWELRPGLADSGPSGLYWRKGPAGWERVEAHIGELRGPARWNPYRLAWDPADDIADSKEVSPKGSGATRGTVYADPLARAILAAGGQARPGDALMPDAPDVRWSGLVLVVEGGPTWLRFAVDPARLRILADRAEADAVVGIWPGAWPDDALGDALAARFAGATRVLVAPDRDENQAGERLAEKVGRCLTRAGARWKPWRWWEV